MNLVSDTNFCVGSVSRKFSSDALNSQSWIVIGARKVIRHYPAEPVGEQLWDSLRCLPVGQMAMPAGDALL